MSNKEISEEKTAASSYIITFYQHVQALNDSYSNFENVLLEIKSKYKGISFDEIPLENQEKTILLSNCQNTRYYVHRTYISYKTILKGLKKDKLKEKEFIELEKLWKKLKEQFILNRDDILNYVININDSLQEDIMKELLVKSTDIVKRMYGTEQNKTTDE